MEGSGKAAAPLGSEGSWKGAAPGQQEQMGCLNPGGQQSGHGTFPSHTSDWRKSLSQRKQLQTCLLQALVQVLESGKSQTMDKVPRAVTARGDGAQRTLQEWWVTGMPTSALGAARTSLAPAQGAELSPASPPAEDLQSMQIPPIGNTGLDARLPTRTRHLHPQGLHPCWGEAGGVAPCPQCVHGTTGLSWGCCGWALPTISSPWMHSSVPALEDVLRTLQARTLIVIPDTQEPPPPLPGCHRTSQGHFSTNCKPEGNSTQHGLYWSLSAAHALPSFPARLPAQCQPGLHPPRDPRSDRAAGLQSSSCIPRCASPAPRVTWCTELRRFDSPAPRHAAPETAPALTRAQPQTHACRLPSCRCSMPSRAARHRVQRATVCSVPPRAACHRVQRPTGHQHKPTAASTSSFTCGCAMGKPPPVLGAAPCWCSQGPSAGMKQHLESVILEQRSVTNKQQNRFPQEAPDDQIKSLLH